MNSRSLLHSAITFSILGLASRAADAACVIHGARPTVGLPTMEAGQQFSFIATAGCDKLRFRVRGTTFVAIPKAGPDMGTKDRTYKVVLSESEWNSLVDEGDTTFTWSIIGTTSAGVTTRVTTTNELKDEGGGTIDLSMADAKLVGEESGDVAGVSLSGAGDVDGDGHDDVLIGSGNDEGGEASGAAYLVRGPVSGTVDLSMADAKLVAQVGDYMNSSAGAGDVDGDGLGDLLVGAHGNDEVAWGAGVVYVVTGPVTGTLDLSLADAKLLGEVEGGFAGWDVSGAGDVDHDGHDDVLVVPGNYDPHIYLVLGPMAGTVDLALADATLVGERNGDLLLQASDAGDVDADGHGDLLLGAYGNDEGGPAAGAAYLVLGPVTGTFDLSLANAKLLGETANDWAGADVSGAGDVDSDGHDDILVGAPASYSAGSWAGAAYLVLGPVTGTLDLSLADAKLLGELDHWTGEALSSAGDVDGDGHDDLLVGTWWDSAALVLGPVTGTLDLARADLKLVGEEIDDACCNVADAGDVDADGRADILLSDPGNDHGGDRAGAAYLLYGAGLF